jgi:hypothetical protein
MFSGQMFAGRMFFGQLWSRARAVVVAPSDPWVRINRDTQAWTEL